MKRWYVVQVYAGYEKIVVADMKKRIEEQSLQDQFGGLLIPSAKMKQFFADADAMQDQQLFPGYILVETSLTPESQRLVLKTPKVLRFLGGKDPVALSQKEVDRVLAQMRGELILSSIKPEFEIGKEVEVKEGPFAGFIGIISKVDFDAERLIVMVSIFGRMTPVELGFGQVKN